MSLSGELALFTIVTSTLGADCVRLPSMVVTIMADVAVTALGVAIGTIILATIATVVSAFGAHNAPFVGVWLLTLITYGVVAFAIVFPVLLLLRALMLPASRDFATPAVNGGGRQFIMLASLGVAVGCCVFLVATGKSELVPAILFSAATMASTYAGLFFADRLFAYRSKSLARTELSA